MNRTYALLRMPGSPLGDSLARRLGERGLRAELLDLDAPLRGEPVTVSPASVIWQGVDLAAAAAVLVERPVFAWPQPGGIGDLIRDGAVDQERASAEREARSLIASAIPAAAESGRVVNPPLAAHLAASPAIALEYLDDAGLEVHPWRLAPAPGDADGQLLLDAAGRDLFHQPGRPRAGDPALEPDPIPGAVLSVLVAGGEALGGLRHAGGAAWAAGEPAEPLAAGEIPAADGELALRAADSVGMGFAAVSVMETSGRCRVLWFDAGPDLAGWDARLDGRIAAGLADYLIAVAAGDRGRHA